MSISDTAPVGGVVPSTKLAAVAKSTAPRRNRIRRGQKLDEVVLLAEQRMHSSDEPRSTAAVVAPSASSSAAAGPSSAAGGESPFQLQEYLAMLVRRDPHAVEAITSLPTEADIEASDKGKSRDDSEDDGMLQNVDTDIWVYEQLRRLVLDLTTPWLTALQQECDRDARPQTCAAMNAGDWMYLCASHGEEKQCCAIDYMVHTLDGATSLLNSARHFPSRTYVPNTSLRHFGSIARRLSRIFVHAWCYHRDTFLACEAETSLYERFYSLVQTYDLTATDNLPPRPSAAGHSGDESELFSRGPVVANGTTAKRERSGTAAQRTLPQSMQADAVGLVPPPAPSPRPTAILSRPDHDEADDHPPSWAAQPTDADTHSFLSSNDDEDDEDEEDAEDEEEHTQKLAGVKVDDDATISLRGTAVPAAHVQDEAKPEEEQTTSETA